MHSMLKIFVAFTLLSLSVLGWQPGAGAQPFGCSGDVAAADLVSCFGPWAGLVACESGGQARVENPHSTASGTFQFLDTTWRWVVTDMGRADLVGLRAKDASVADQFAAAIHLRDMAGGGISHWVCGWAYDRGVEAGSGAALVASEQFVVLEVPFALQIDWVAFEPGLGNPLNV